MCGRYNFTPSAEAFIEAFGMVEDIAGLPAAPMYNIAPSSGKLKTWVPALRPGKAGPRRLVMSHWPLIPFWAKTRNPGFNTANAKGETIAEKPAFRGPWRRGQRCLIPANGYYEWQASAATGAKQPYHICLPDRGLFAFGGVWDRWRDADGRPLESCAIITTEPANELRGIHPRMPLIIDESCYDDWLRQPAAKALEMIRPCPDGTLVAYAISTHVNNPRNNDPRCLQPLAGQSDG